MTWLWRFTLVFATVSILMVSCGLYISYNSEAAYESLTPDSTEPAKRIDFVCIGSEWAPVTAFGNLYLLMVSMICLLQINASQFILIRLPFKLGVFDTETKASLKSVLLKKMSMINDQEGSGNNDLKARLAGIAKTKEEFRI